MKLPRFRFTVRRMMVAVAIVAITIQSVRWGRLSREYSEWADACAKRAAWMRITERRTRLGLPGNVVEQVLPPGYDPTASINYSEFLSRKHEYAARHPWLTLPPDPPDPD